MLGVVVIICVISIAYRLQKLAAQRVDAEKRASVAFEEMNRTTKELRTRKGNDPADDPTLTPGERLRRMYPGVQRSTSISEGEST
jgi:uncharacterized membrane protein